MIKTQLQKARDNNKLYHAIVCRYYNVSLIFKVSLSEAIFIPLYYIDTIDDKITKKIKVQLVKNKSIKTLYS